MGTPAFHERFLAQIFVLPWIMRTTSILVHITTYTSRVKRYLIIHGPEMSCSLGFCERSSKSHNYVRDFEITRFQLRFQRKVYEILST